jgi:hypothetical protein
MPACTYPNQLPDPKRNQIEAYGAELRPSLGAFCGRRGVLADVQRGIAYASHAYLPFGLAGIATIAYELWGEQSSCIARHCHCPGRAWRVVIRAAAWF